MAELFQAGAEYVHRVVEHRDLALPALIPKIRPALRQGCDLGVGDDAGGVPHVGHAPAQVGVPLRMAEDRIEIVEMGEARVIEFGQQPVLAHRADVVIGREHDVPTGVAGHHPGQHLFVALVDGVADLDAELALEVGNGVGRDVGGPVEDVEPRAPGAAGSRRSRRVQGGRACAASSLLQPL